MIYDDPIVDEVHRWREQLLASYEGDMHALAEAARRGTEAARQAGKTVYTGTPRPPRAPIVTGSTQKKVG